MGTSKFQVVKRVVVCPTYHSAGHAPGAEHCAPGFEIHRSKQSLARVMSESCENVGPAKGLAARKRRNSRRWKDKVVMAVTVSHFKVVESVHNCSLATEIRLDLLLL